MFIFIERTTVLRFIECEDMKKVILFVFLAKSHYQDYYFAEKS